MTNRRERRWQLRAVKMLRIKNMYSPFSEVGKLWYDKMKQEGRAIFLRNRDAAEKKIYGQLAEKEANLKVHFTSLGYSSTRIDKMLEAWRLLTIKDQSTYRADRKAATALFKEASQIK